MAVWQHVPNCIQYSLYWIQFEICCPTLKCHSVILSFCLIQISHGSDFRHQVTTAGRFNHHTNVVILILQPLQQILQVDIGNGLVGSDTRDPQPPPGGTTRYRGWSVVRFRSNTLVHFHKVVKYLIEVHPPCSFNCSNTKLQMLPNSLHIHVMLRFYTVQMQLRACFSFLHSYSLN